MNQAKSCILKQIRKLCTRKDYAERIIPLKKQVKILVPLNPVKSVIDSKKLPAKTKIDADTIALLERLSLVDCANKEGIATLEAAIEFADQILQVETAGIEPLVTVLEDKPLRLRKDEVTDGHCRHEILKNATVVEEDYFVSPPGNIPLEAREDLLFEKETEKIISENK